LAILVYWFLGFILDDISQHPGPSYRAIEDAYLSAPLVQKKAALLKASNQLKENIQTQQQQLNITQTSIRSYRDTMNQLLDLQKVSIQKSLPVSPESEKSLKDVIKLYLSYQQQFQALNQSLSQQNLQQQTLVKQINDTEGQLSKQSAEAWKHYQQKEMTHHWQMAGIQLLVLIPLLLLGLYGMRKYQLTIYKSLWIAINCAITLKIVCVLHEHFPSTAFNYILIITLIVITIRLLISMLRMSTAPKLDWLLKQYRESYQKLECPICQFSIQPGYLKLMMPQLFLKESVAMNAQYLEKIHDYHCPCCGEKLFEKCSGCAHTRHSLLLYCDHCGAEKKIS
jgi:predicted RNA-binding Zn-ribbon protein involved in translation (DUF1610 family)